MKRKAIFLATLMACGMAAEAQQKQSGAYANGSHNTVLARKAIDTANLRIKYAWGRRSQLEYPIFINNLKKH